MRKIKKRNFWSLLLVLFTFSLTRKIFLSSKTTFAQGLQPQLIDFWEGRAVFTNEERIYADGPYNAEYDFNYRLHDSGMAVIEDVHNPGTVYYLIEWWNPEPDHLEPHIYKSTDGGKNFTHLSKIFNTVTPGENTCPENSTYAYWNYDGKIWCHFQMREPDVMYYNGRYYIVYESAARSSDGKVLLGPTVVALPSLDISGPVQVVHGVNFRQHPLFITNNYDGDPNKSGLQQTSASTPFWYANPNSIYVFWAGVHPINGTWERVDTYRGHFCSTPNSPQADCTDPISCYFSIYDEWLITNPNLSIGGPERWDSKNSEGKSIIKEGNYYYMLYQGGNCPDLFCPGALWGISMARSLDLVNWTRKDKNGRPSIVDDLEYGVCGVYGKLTKISGKYYVYFYEARPPGLPGGPAGIARVYRRSLEWKDGFQPSPTPSFWPGDVNHDSVVDVKDALQILTNFQSAADQIANYYDPVGDTKVNLLDFAWVVRDWGKN